MIELKIDPEFRDVLPSKEEDYLKLEKTVLSDGRFTDPFITWNGFIIDGHTRYRIMQNHPEINLQPYEKKMDDVLPDRYAAIVWIATHQESRRNLNSFELADIHKKAFDAQKMTESFHGNQHTKVGGVETDPTTNHDGRTSTVLAKDFGITTGQFKHSVRIGNAMEEAERLVPGAKEKIKSGETGVPKSTVEDILTIKNEEERKGYVEAVLDGKNPKAKDGKWANKEVRDRYAQIREISKEMGMAKTRTTFDDVISLLNTISDDFINKVERTINSERKTLTGDERWPDAIDGYFDSIIEDIKEMKWRIFK